MTNKEIARKLGISSGTIKIHLAALYRVLGVRNRQTAAAAGARLMEAKV
jgi:DNA-binding NarL/FixJ family response regulator